MKDNGLVAEACRELCLAGRPVELRVYGRNYCGSDDFLGLEMPGGEIHFMGQVDQAEWLRQLGEVSVFVMASLHEPFGLSAMEAVQAGCSLLVSGHCGAAEALALAPGDVIADGEDSAEVAGRIARLLDEPNGARLVGSIDYKDRSWDVCARAVWAVCCEAKDRSASGSWKNKLARACRRSQDGSYGPI